MTATQISVATAPRDLEGLKKAGRFNLRVLAQELGLFEKEADKTAFMQASNDQQAETVLKYLLEKDGGPKASGKGGGGAATGRSPSTKNAGKAASTAGKATGEVAAGSGGGGGAAAGGAAVGAGAEKILQKLGELIEKVEGFTASVDNLAERVGQLEGISAGTNRFVALSIGLSGKLAEQVLGAGLEQILDVTLEDMPVIEAAMKRMAPAEEEGEGEGEEEGNDEE